MYDFDNPALRVGNEYFPLPSYRLKENVSPDTQRTTDGGNMATVVNSNTYTIRFRFPTEKGNQFISRIQEVKQKNELPEVTLTGLRTTVSITMGAAAVQTERDAVEGEHSFTITSPKITNRQAY